MACVIRGTGWNDGGVQQQKAPHGAQFVFCAQQRGHFENDCRSVRRTPMKFGGSNGRRPCAPTNVNWGDSIRARPACRGRRGIHNGCGDRATHRVAPARRGGRMAICRPKTMVRTGTLNPPLFLNLVHLPSRSPDPGKSSFQTFLPRIMLCETTQHNAATLKKTAANRNTSFRKQQNIIIKKRLLSPLQFGGV
jgi:hypothetical protein